MSDAAAPRLPEMGCPEGAAFIAALDAAAKARYNDASPAGAKTREGMRSRFLALISDELGGCESGADVSAAALLGALERTVRNNRSASHLAFEAVDCAVSCGFCSDDAFFAWFEKHRALLAGMESRGRIALEAMRERSYERIIIARSVQSGRRQDVWHAKVIVTDAGSSQCRLILEAFVETGAPVRAPGDAAFLQHFEESLGFTPSSYSDFTVGTFDAQLRWFLAMDAGPMRQAAISQLKRFYAFVISQLPDDQTAFTYATGLTKDALLYPYLADTWVEGYRAVVFNPLDPPPSFPKWLLFPSAEEALHSSFVLGKPQQVDTSTHEGFQQLLCEWLWSRGDSAKALRASARFCKKLIECVAEDGPPLDGAWQVRPGAVLSALASFKGRGGASYMRHVKGYMRSFLEYGDGASLAVDPSCWLLLANTRRDRDDGASDVDALSVEETAAVAEALRSRAADSLSGMLAYTAFCVQALTPLRQGEILTLRISEITEGTREGMHAIEKASKTSGTAPDRTEIPRKVYELLMAVEEATRPIRETCTSDDVRDYLFLVRGQMGAVAPLNDDNYRDRLISAGKACGIAGCTPSRLRKRHMTEVIEQGIERNIGRLLVNRLTKHASEEILNRHYLREDIRRYLEATHGVLIGNPRIAGQVAEDEATIPYGPEDEVEGGSGLCRNDACKVAGTTTCLMCAGFLTSPRFIPQMEEAIAVLQAQIACAGSDHERQHLVAAKKLYLAYLGKMIQMKEGDGRA